MKRSVGDLSESTHQSMPVKMFAYVITPSPFPSLPTASQLFTGSCSSHIVSLQTYSTLRLFSARSKVSSVMSSLRIAGRVPRQLRTGPLLRQIRRESTNASQSSTSNAPSSAGGISGALAGGLVGGGVALAGGYAWYHFSGN